MNNLLEYVDRLTGRRAFFMIRLLSFLFIGGVGAIVNVICFTIAYTSLLSFAVALVAYFSAFFLATEVSILVNFALNDCITFRHLRVAQRSLWTRCLRFHATSMGGVALTLGISFSLLHFAHVLALVSQASALVFATVFNFAGHHFFTYRTTPKGHAAVVSTQSTTATHTFEQS